MLGSCRFAAGDCVSARLSFRELPNHFTRILTRPCHFSAMSTDPSKERLHQIRRLLDAARHRQRYYDVPSSLLRLPARHRGLIRYAAALSTRGNGTAGLMWRYCQRCRHYSDRSLLELDLAAHDHLSGQPDAYIAELLHNPAPLVQRLVKQAARFVAEVELYIWITRCNALRGVAPQAHAVIRHYRELTLWSHIPLESRHGDMLGTASLRYQLVWLYQFRKRWGCAVQRLKVENVLEPAELQTKAGSEGRVSFSTSRLHAILIGQVPLTTSAMILALGPLASIPA